MSAPKVKEQINQLLSQLSDKDLAEMPADKILELRKQINPYGRTIAGSDKFLNFSLTQISHEYHKKLITTAFIGFLNRMCDEWKVPDGIPVVSVYDALKDPSLLETPSIAAGNDSIQYDYEFNRRWMKKRIVVKEFLEEMFQFNPDEHVRSAYRPNYKDAERKPIETMAARLAVDAACIRDTKLAAERKQYLEENGVKFKKVKKVIKARDGTTKTIIKEVPINELPLDTRPTQDVHKVDGVDPTLPGTVRNMIPPADMYGRFKTYLTENYEELRDAVAELYCEKPNFELAINPYVMCDTREEAEAFKKQHADEVISEVFTAETGKWNFFDSFKQQRESVNFYNKNTIILEEMTKQIERDERLGQDLMNKRVANAKKKNIVESGPDSENFSKWRSENNTLQKMGAVNPNDDDVPEDAIQVDVWKLAKGGVELTKEKFYTASEAPDFVK